MMGVHPSSFYPPPLFHTRHQNTVYGDSTHLPVNHVKYDGYPETCKMGGSVGNVSIGGYVFLYPGKLSHD